MIAVLGRPGLADPRGVHTDASGLSGLAADIARAAAAAGPRVELVGSIGDDPEGDEVVVRLGRSGIGHAALLRDPAGHTPVAGQERTPPPRIEAADVALGLGYLADIKVIVVAEPLDADALGAAHEAASYHGAPLIVVVPAGGHAPGLRDATVLEAPERGEGAFARMAGMYAAGLDRGSSAEQSFADAVHASGWERPVG